MHVSKKGATPQGGPFRGRLANLPLSGRYGPFSLVDRAVLRRKHSAMGSIAKAIKFGRRPSQALVGSVMHLPRWRVVSPAYDSAVSVSQIGAALFDFSISKQQERRRQRTICFAMFAYMFNSRGLRHNREQMLIH